MVIEGLSIRTNIGFEQRDCVFEANLERGQRKRNAGRWFEMKYLIVEKQMSP